ncbi:hypothetical protein LIER_22631 [Lithospermum erythrorhizon]|uniref:Uncharacterized protein n=1 Tax=Lithospermum erythrorhizon TaxID=34254 RepID=A0AAV3R0A7_LITER
MVDTEGMKSIDIPCIAGTDGLTVGNDDEVRPSVADTGTDVVVDLPEKRENPTIDNGVDDTLHADIEEVEIHEDVGHEKKRSKKRKHKTGVDVSEPTKPKKKLRKEERTAKRARTAERKAVEKVVEEETDDDVWTPANEPQGDGAEEAEQGANSDKEDVAAVMSRRRKEASFNLEQFMFYQTIQHAQSHVVLKPIAYPSLLCCIMESHHLDILTATNEEAPYPGFITIIPKLLQGTHVVDISLRAVETGGASGGGN